MICAVSIGLIFVIGLSPTLLYFSLPITFRKVLLFLTTLLIGVGILLASFGYRGIKKILGLLSGAAGFAFGIVASVLFFSTAMVDLFTPEYVILIYPPPLIHQINSVVRFVNLLVFGLTQIVWGISHFKSRKLCKKPKISLVTGGFFVVSGVVMLSIFFVDIGSVLSIISFLFASNAFLAFRSEI